MTECQHPTIVKSYCTSCLSTVLDRPVSQDAVEAAREIARLLRLIPDVDIADCCWGDVVNTLSAALQSHRDAVRPVSQESESVAEKIVNAYFYNEQYDDDWLSAQIADAIDRAHPKVSEPDDYIAWCRYVNHGQYENSGADIITIELCDSDAEGAFKIYCAPSRDAARPVVSEDDEQLLMSLRDPHKVDDGIHGYWPDPLCVAAADRIEELLRWLGTEQEMHRAWRKRAEEAEGRE